LKKISIFLLFITAWIPLAAHGQALGIEQRINGEDLLKAFDPIKERIQDSSAVIYSGREKLVYGTLVSPNGYILTKASEVINENDLYVRIGAKKYKNLQILALRKDWDLALLKVPAENLPELAARETSDLPFGSWLISNGSTTRKVRRIRVGVYSAKPRKIGGIIVALGIAYNATEDGLKVNGIGEGGALDAGLQKGDLITKIEDQEIRKSEDLESLLQKKVPGDILSLQINREGEHQTLNVELKDRIDVFGEQKSRNDSMSGRYSKRRTSFPRIIQHDIPLSNESIGGPVFTLDGKCIGMNIAVANRCESYAIPIEELLKVSKEMIADYEALVE